MEILKPGGRPAGNNEDGDTEETGGFAEGVEEAAVVVITIRAGGIDLRFKLRHGLRAARRRSTTERVRRAFLERNGCGENYENRVGEWGTHLLTSVALK